MECNLLTVNNITKLCNTKIYVYNNEPIPMQWYNFQLNWLINKLGIVRQPMSLVAQRTKSLNESSPSDLVIYNNRSNTHIFNVLKQKFKDNYKFENINGVNCHHINIPKEMCKKIDEEELLKYGFYSKERVTINDVKNEAYFGGYSNFTTSLNDNNTDIVVKLRDIEEEALYTSQKPEIYNEQFPFPHELINNVSKKEEHDTEKMDEVVKIQENIDGGCIKGVFKWKNNSCYADSILIMLFRRIYNNSNGLLSDTIRTPILFDEHSIADDMCKTSGNRIEKINDILNELNKLLIQIDNNKVLYIENFLNNMDKCISGDEKFGNKETQSPSDFLSKLINIIYNNKLSELN